MRRLLDAARWFWQHPLAWVLPVIWGLLAALVHWMTPVAPVYKFGITAPARELDDREPKPELGFGPRQFAVVGASADGTVVVTMVRNDRRHMLSAGSSWVPKLRYGPVRVWDVRAGKLINEFGTKDDNVNTITLSPDGSWLSMNRNSETELYMVHSGEKFTFQFSPHNKRVELRHSTTGEWVVYRQDDRLEIFYPHTNQVSTLLDAPWSGAEDVRRRILSGDLQGLSADDRWLGVRTWDQERHRLIILDTTSGEIIANLRVPTVNVAGPSAPEDVKFSRDKRTIGFHCGDDVVVMQIASDKKFIAIPCAKLVGWDATQQNVIVYHPHDRKRTEKDDPACLESWSIATDNRQRFWPIPKRVYPAPPFPYWYHAPRDTEDPWPDAMPVLSPDGAHVVWASYQHKEVASNNASGGTHLSDCHYDVRMLTTRNFSEAARWRVDIAGVPAQSPLMRWTLPNGQWVFSDHDHVEIWRAPPRVLSQSAGIALVPTWLVCCVWILVSRRRARTRDAKASIAP